MPHFWNLNEDPQLSNMLVHLAKPGQSSIYSKLIWYAHQVTQVTRQVLSLTDTMGLSVSDQGLFVRTYFRAGQFTISLPLEYIMCSPYSVMK